MIEIDGSMGEGGGQVLRSALTLALLTGRPLHIHSIRAGRSKPGLRAQHLTAVKAAARISGAELEGGRLGSTELSFQPGPLRAGRYRFDIGTAGATSLVLQTLFLPLSHAGAASSLTLTGGTHVPWSPCYHYLELHWLPILRGLGYDAQLWLDQAGFFPRGGGQIRANIRPAGTLQPFQLKSRGTLQRISGVAGVANLSRAIAGRLRRQARYRLGDRHPVQIKVADMPSPGKGAFLLLMAEYEKGQSCAFALGEPGKRAERVADEAVEGLKISLGAADSLDPYLADQLLLPLAIAPGKSRFRTARVTRHLLTNAEVVRAFLPVKIEIEGSHGGPAWVAVTGSAINSTDGPG
jgi:RNA 3'-terminal phosphate cyclase (ATP)